MCPKTKRQANRDTLPMRLTHVFYDYAFGIAMDTHGMWDLAFIDDSDITLLVETWEIDTQRTQGLGNYNAHSLIWAMS